MKSIFKPGDIRVFTRTVRDEDCADFESGRVHGVYSTFALARDAEWSTRLFVLEMKESHEEGIGTMVSVIHQAPAFVGESVDIRSRVESLKGNELICSYQALVGRRLIATGQTAQKIMLKTKLEQRFKEVRK